MADDTGKFDMNAAPMRIGMVQLKVRDLEAVSSFYQRVMGLSPVETSSVHVILGNGTASLLGLVGDPALTPLDPRQAGLFHTAFLLPSRGNLAAWLANATTLGISLLGASDHLVSEALYLADPEGNGIEIYADRPETQWRTQSGEVEMTTDPLDLQALLATAGSNAWQGFPSGGCMGHVHLRVGDMKTADRFYCDVLGFHRAAQYTGASFYGSGGYHHQLAGNVWKSRNAGARPRNMAGLGVVEIIARQKATIDAVAARAGAAGIAVESTAGSLTLRDPWGTEIRLA